MQVTHEGTVAVQHPGAGQLREPHTPQTAPRSHHPTEKSALQRGRPLLLRERFAYDPEWQPFGGPLELSSTRCAAYRIVGKIEEAQGHAELQLINVLSDNLLPLVRGEAELASHVPTACREGVIPTAWASWAPSAGSPCATHMRATWRHSPRNAWRYARRAIAPGLASLRVSRASTRSPTTSPRRNGDVTAIVTAGSVIASTSMVDARNETAHDVRSAQPSRPGAPGTRWARSTTVANSRRAGCGPVEGEERFPVRRRPTCRQQEERDHRCGRPQSARRPMQARP